MKKIYVILLTLTATLISCSKHEHASLYETSREMIVYVSTSSETKTTNDGLSTRWAESDRISLYHSESGSNEYVMDNAFSVIDPTTGKFQGTLREELDEAKSYDWYAIYPYDNNGNPNQSNAWTIGGTKAGQTQNGNNSMAHLAGTNYPLVGRIKNLAANEIPHIVLKNVASILEFELKNELGKNITVKSIKVQSEENIVGFFRIAYADENLTFTPLSDRHVASTSTLTIKNGTAISSGQTARFYMGIVPFTAESGTEMAVTVNVVDDNGTTDEWLFGTEFEEDFQFSPSKIITFDLKYNHMF